MKITTKPKMPPSYKLINNPKTGKRISWWAYWWEGFKFKFTWRF